MSYAGFSDVALYVPDLADADEDKVFALLEQAEAEILVEFPDLATRVADGRTKLVLLVRVEAEMVASVMRNPRAYVSQSEGVGSLSSSHTINVEVASGLLSMTDKHRAFIRGEPVSGGAAFTIRPGAGAHPAGWS